MSYQSQKHTYLFSPFVTSNFVEIIWQIETIDAITPDELETQIYIILLLTDTKKGKIYIAISDTITIIMMRVCCHVCMTASL